MRAMVAPVLHDAARWWQYRASPRETVGPAATVRSPPRARSFSDCGKWRTQCLLSLEPHWPYVKNIPCADLFQQRIGHTIYQMRQSDSVRVAKTGAKNTGRLFVWRKLYAVFIIYRSRFWQTSFSFSLVAHRSREYQFGHDTCGHKFICIIPNESINP